MYIAIVAIVFFATMAMMAREGMWSNALTLINLVISGLIAFGFYAPLSIWLDERLSGEFTYVIDFATLWGLFVIATVILRTITDRISRTRLRLKNPFEQILATVIALVAGYVMAGFVMATMHAAPLAEDSLAGSLQYEPSQVESASGLTAPDLGWLRFVERITTPEGFGGRPFSAAAFVKIYADHRSKLSEAGSLKVQRG